ncbi:MAG: VOC family protein [Gemmatimonadota bacterium]
MSSSAPKIYPCLAYRDPVAALEFLTTAFGFRKMMEVPDDKGSIVHAEMSFGPEVIMLGSAKAELGWMSPLDLPALSQTVCMYVPNVDEHYQRAKASGAKIVRELADTSYGAREYSAKDLEGHEWHFGTYRPTP